MAGYARQAATDTLEKRLWASADQFRANSGPILGIIFLRFDFVLATATRASAKLELAKPDRRSVGETGLHYLWIQLFHSALKKGGGRSFRRTRRIRHGQFRLRRPQL
jgi:hypothetical protein